MEKAYDVKALVEKLKSHGLDVAEEGARDVVASLFDWVSESAKLSSTPYDDMALIVLPKLQELALSEIDKINGKQGA